MVPAAVPVPLLGRFLCSTSLGEDTGGSIRRPAAWGGLVGLRPSWGLVSRYGVMPGVWSMDTVGPISRTVEDAAMTLQAIAGHDSKDQYSWNIPVPNYRAALDGNIRGLRVGIVSELIHAEVVHQEVRDTVLKATSVLSELGAIVEEVSIPLTSHANAISSALLAAEPAQHRAEWLKHRLQDFGHDNRVGLLTGSLIPAQAYYKALKLRSLLRQQVLEVLERYDVLVSPTSGQTAVPRLEHDPMVTSKETASRLPFMRTNTFNVASAPAISVPCGFTSADLPVGLQIGSRPGAEEMVFKVAHAYEQSTPWHNMRPAAV